MSLRPMNLRQLQHFVVLARTGNVHQASQRLSLTQPALSKSIRLLEEELAVQLFERLPRGMRLTSAGQWLLDESARLLADAERLRNDLALIRRQAEGAVRLGAGTVLCASLLPRSLAELQRLNGQIQVTVESGYWLEHQQLLLDGEIDFLVADARELEDLQVFEIEPLPQEPIRIYVRPQHPLAQQRRLKLADLQQQAFSRPTRIPRELEADLQALPLSQGAGALLASNDFGLLKSTACCSDLLLFSPPGAVLDEVRQRRLVPLDLPLAAQTRFAVVWLKQRPLSAAAELMKQALLQVAAGDQIRA